MLTPLEGAAFLLASAVAGAVNAVAGGGTLVTFPTLVSLGLGPIAANATSTVGLLPGTLGSIGGYRREIRAARGAIAWLVPPSLAGGAAGALLLLATPPAVFARLAPFLVLGATALFMLQGRLRAAAEDAAPRARAGVALLQLAIAIYGGYFGAGIGILMLAAFGLLRLESIHTTNGLKTLPNRLEAPSAKPASSPAEPPSARPPPTRTSVAARFDSRSPPENP